VSAPTRVATLLGDSVPRRPEHKTRLSEPFTANDSAGLLLRPKLPRSFGTCARRTRVPSTGMRLFPPTLRLASGSAALLAALLPACLDLGTGSDAGTAGNGSGTAASRACITSYSSCGGDVTGTWAVQSICSVGNPVDAINATFVQYPDCSGVCTAVSLTASGQKKYDSGSLTSGEVFEVFETWSLSEACFNEYVGTSLTDNTCQTFGTQSGFVTCAVSGGTCVCQLQETLSNNATSYSVAGNALTEIGGGSEIGPRVDYCVIGNTLTEQRTLPTGIEYVITYARL
jgi:hypothetical protein